MEGRKEKNNAPWLSVPQFGDWDQKGELPDYSIDFSKIRETRKQNKMDASRASIGNEAELNSYSTAAAAATIISSKNNTIHNDHHHYHRQNRPPTTRRSFLRHFNCFAKA